MQFSSPRHQGPQRGRLATLVCLAASSLLLACGAQQDATQPKLLATSSTGSTGTSTSFAQYTDWPNVPSAIGKDPAQEARIAQILAGMTLAQKIGQMTQPEIKSITPDQVRQYYIGSVLNGGGSWPNNNKYASAADWVNLATQYHAASMNTDMAVKIPLLWGTDAVHGHNNVYGATIFPHNIGLGAARDAALIRRIGGAVGQAVRATGISWVFAPTLSVVRDDRWGRTYEGFSEEAAIVRDYASAYVSGLQGSFANDANVIATAKHFIGDGGTYLGIDQGENQASLSEMINLHGQGYYGALGAGAQTVMASFNSWNNGTQNMGKMHGSKTMLTDILKTKMGFDGLVVSDWNGIAQVPGCSNASCPQAINAGLDIIMVPDDWKAFISNTMAQVQSGQIPMSRIDDAVTRILRVKMRAGLFNGKTPAQNQYAGQASALQARALAREAVQKSLVLLKNNGSVLPLARSKRLLVVGKSADSMQNQTGGWTLSWQGTDNSNADFPNGDTILAGLRSLATSVTYSADGSGVNPANFDAIIAVIGETPYAEGVGDISSSGSLAHSSRYPQDLAVLRAVAGKGKPVITVFVGGRPVYANDLLNLSDAFVSAWLPGTEGKGVADVLMRNASGGINLDFSGRLSFSWPKTACQTSNNIDDADYAPLFAWGYGLRYASTASVPQLEVNIPGNGCNASGGSTLPIFNQVEKAPFVMYASGAANNWQSVPIGSDLNAVLRIPATNPALEVSTTQVNVQQDAKQMRFISASQIFAQSAGKMDITGYADAALQFDMIVQEMPQGPVTLAMDCGWPCRGALDATTVFERSLPGVKQTVKVPLTCFAAQGADLRNINTPFLVYTPSPMTAAFANIKIVAGAANDADALPCAQLTPGAPKLGPAYTMFENGQFAAGFSGNTWATQSGVLNFSNTNGELQIQYANQSGGNGLFFISGNAVNLNALANASLKFEVLVESYGVNTSGLAVKMESPGNNCVSHDYAIGRPAVGSWQTVSIALAQLTASKEACFSLGSVNAPFAILPVWGQQSGVQMRLRKLRFE